jgi:uncharacterized protein
LHRAFSKLVFIDTAKHIETLDSNVVITVNMNITSDQVIAETQAWITHAVVGLNLCPFARAVQVKNQIRCVVSDATHIDALMAQLCEEMHFLAEAHPAKVETTLLIHPQVLTDFLDFNDFLELADAALEALDYDGVLQVAPFHPQFQFEGTEPDDVTNATNRAPYPTLHLLREDSVERAVAAFPNAEAVMENIVDTNIATLEKLGATGWADIQSKIKQASANL